MIKKISIQNFKAFTKTEEVKLGNLTLLTGINGRGKSSFLQALLLLSQSLRNSGQHTLDNLLINNEWISLGEFSDIINIGVSRDTPIVFTLETDAETDWKFELSYRMGEMRTIGELCSLKVDGKEMFSESSFYDEGAIHGQEEMGNFSSPTISGYTSLTDLQRMYYVAADREEAQDEENYNVSPSIRIDKCGKNILNIIYKEGEAFQRQIAQELSEIFDGATFQIKAEGQSLHLYMDSVNEGHAFRPVNVGYGYSYILSLLTVGLLAKEGDFIIMENPEAHLHPSAQSAMMRFFCSKVLPKKVQVFVETHSDHIVNASLIAVRNEDIPLTREQLEILFFYRQKDSGKHITIQNLEITEKGRVKNPPKNFCDQYAMDLRKLMGF